MRITSRVFLLAALALVAPTAAAALPGLDAVHAAGRTGAGATLAIVSDDPAPLVALARAIAPDADVRALPAATPLADLDADVVLLDLPRDAPTAPAEALAARALVIAPTGDDALRHWGGPWRDADGDGLLDFAAADDALAVDLRAGIPFDARIAWSSGAAADDYDLFLYDADLKTPLAWSNAYQADGAPREERIRLTPTADARGQLVVRAFASGDPARFSLLAPITELAVADGSALPHSLIPGVVSVGAAHEDAPSSLLPTTGRAGEAPALLAPAATSREAAARVAGLAALLAADRPDLSPAALAAVLGAGPVDAAQLLRRADVTPALALTAVPAVAGAMRAGPVTLTIAFDDALGSAGNATLVLADGARVPLDVALDGRGIVRATGAIPTTAADGGVAVDLDAFRDWAGHDVEPARLPTDIVVDLTPPVVAWEPLPALAASTIRLAWNVSDATSGVVAARLDVLEDGAWRVAEEELPLAGDLVWTPTLDGETRFRVAARDAAGNTVTSFSDGVLVDTTPPVLAPPPADHPLTLPLGDAGAGLVPESVQVALDGAPVAHFIDGNGLQVLPGAPLAPGYHELVVTAADLAGNVGTTTTGFFVPGADMDATYPTTAAPAHPSGTPPAPPTWPPAARGGARETVLPESGDGGAPTPAATADDALPAWRGLEVAPPPSPALAAPGAPAPEYGWQPPAMVLFFALLVAPILYWRRESLARFGRDARIFLANEWARILRAKWRVSEARWPKRLALHVQAFIVRMRWRRARRV